MASFKELESKEYRAIQRHYSNLVDNLGKTVDPAHFARKLRDKSLISESLVNKASVVPSGLTGAERITPVIDAVLAQIKLKASNFHTFMSILMSENSDLAEAISKYYTSSLELHALGVLEGVSEWKELGHQLNTDPEKLLQLSQCGRDPDYCRAHVVSEWLEGDKGASWEKLCIALEQMGRDAEVLKIREQYISLGHGDVPAVMSSEDCAESVVAEQVDEFDGRFADLAFRLQTEMEEKKTPVKKFRQSITYLPQRIREEHLKFIKESLKEIKQSEDIEDLFMHLNLYWNFFDCNLLEHLVRRHGSKELSKEMETYAEDLKAFRENTTVEQLLKVYPDGFRRNELPPSFSQVTCKLDRKASEYTLEELEQFRCRFCSQFSLPTFALMLASFKEGSITIVWHIPSSEVHRFHNATIQWNAISTELVQFQVDDGLLLEFATELNAQALREYTSLTHLYLGSQKIDAGGISSLSSSLRSLQYFDLSKNKFGSEEAECFAQALRENTALTYLDLRVCDIDTNGMVLLSSSLMNKSSLQHFDLRSNEFGSEGAEYLAHALMENTVLTHLNLEGCGIGADGMTLLSSSLRNKSSLKYLDLSGNRFGSEGAEILAHALMENTTLTHLDLWGCDIGADGMTLLSSSLRNKSCLKSLNLSDNSKGARAEILAQALAESTTLTHLVLWGCDIDVDGVALLSSSLRNKSSLESLDLSYNKFGSKGAEFLAQALAENTTLTHLDLEWCDIDIDGMALLSSSLRNKSSLESLDLSDNKFGSKGAEFLAQALAENTTLTHLVLWGCGIGIDGMALLSSSLRNKSSLEYLHLSGNEFGSKGAEFLAEALAENSTLTDLGLRGCDIGDDGMTLLSLSLRNKSRLQWLDLNGNRFGSKGAKILAEALAENSTLTDLGLRGCDIGDDGMTLLSSSLRNKSRLQWLDLNANKFGSNGAKILAEALAENTTLIHLDVMGCDIGDDGFAVLSSSLRNKSCLRCEQVHSLDSFLKHSGGDEGGVEDDVQLELVKDEVRKGKSRFPKFAGKLREYFKKLLRREKSKNVPSEFTAHTDRDADMYIRKQRLRDTHSKDHVHQEAPQRH